MECRKLQWGVDPLRKGGGRREDRFLGFLDRIGAPLMTLRAVGNPFFRFSFTGGTKEGKIGWPAQFKRLLKFLSCTSEVFFVEIDFCKNSVKGREILYSKIALVDFLEGFIQHFQSYIKLGVKEG